MNHYTDTVRTWCVLCLIELDSSAWMYPLSPDTCSSLIAPLLHRALVLLPWAWPQAFFDIWLIPPSLDSTAVRCLVLICSIYCSCCSRSSSRWSSCLIKCRTQFFASVSNENSCFSLLRNEEKNERTRETLPTNWSSSRLDYRRHSKGREKV